VVACHGVEDANVTAPQIKRLDLAMQLVPGQQPLCGRIAPSALAI
jgi:hypothetical protein